MRRKHVTLILTALAMMVLILDSRRAFACAAEGVDICIRTVIPSLFPFFVLSSFLTNALPGSSSVGSVLISGLLGGYPVGAQSAADAYRSGKLTKETADALLGFCSQPGPSFLFGMVAAQFPEAKYVWFLWAVILLSAASVSMVTPAWETSVSATLDKPPLSIATAIKKAMQAMASVCSWVVLFRVILGFAQAWGLWIFPAWAQALISGMMELTNGTLTLGQISSVPARFLIASLILNFGGICVMMQTFSVAGGLEMKHYIGGKLLQGLFSLLYSLCFLGQLGALIPVFFIFVLCRRGNPRKSSRFPASVGV